jgi:hypothetical protein
MIIDQAHGITLKEALFTRFDLPVYVVLNGVKRKTFSGETAYADAQRYFNDLVLAKVYR